MLNKGSFVIFIWFMVIIITFPLIFQIQPEDTLTPEKLIKNIKKQSFNGKRIDFIFSNAGLPEMIDYLEDFSGFNFDLDPKIQIRATYHMRQIPWDQALAAILTDNKLNIDLANDGIKIFEGRKYVLAFPDQKKAKILIFLYKHFYMILFSLALLAAVLTGMILFKKSKIKQNRILRKDLLDQGFADEIEKRIKYLFEIEKIYKNEKLSLISLAEQLKITPHQLSWIINEKINKSFPTLVNLYRIEEVKKKLSQSIHNEIKILQVAFEAGFNTKTSFNRAFKKITGLTPSQYREKHLGRDNLTLRSK